MSFVNDFLKSVAMPIGDLAKWLEQEHQVPVESTIEKWNELTGMKVTIDENSVGCEDVEDQTINIKKKKSNSPTPGVGDLDSLLCQHVFIAGNRKGQQCTTKPKGGNNRCSAHKIKVKKGENSNSDAETTPKKPVKKAIKPKETVNSDSESDAKKKKKSPIKRKPIPESDSDSDSESELPVLITKINPITGKKAIGTVSDFEESD